MWAILAISLHLLVGPDTWVVTDAGTFKDKASCEAAIAAALPDKLSDKHKKLYEDGSLQYSCLKVIEG